MEPPGRRIVCLDCIVERVDRGTFGDRDRIASAFHPQQSREHGPASQRTDTTLVPPPFSAICDQTAHSSSIPALCSAWRKCQHRIPQRRNTNATQQQPARPTYQQLLLRYHNRAAKRSLQCQDSEASGRTWSVAVDRRYVLGPGTISDQADHGADHEPNAEATTLAFTHHAAVARS